MLKQKYLWFILIVILAIALSFYFIYNKGKRGDEGKTEEEIEEFEEEEIEINEAPVKIEKGTVVGMKTGEKEWEIEQNGKGVWPFSFPCIPYRHVWSNLNGIGFPAAGS